MAKFKNTSGFNYKLPNGEIIYDENNPNQSATISVENILSGAEASPVPQDILAEGRRQLGGRTPQFNPAADISRTGTPDLSPSQKVSIPFQNPNSKEAKLGAISSLLSGATAQAQDIKSQIGNITADTLGKPKTPINLPTSTPTNLADTTVAGATSFENNIQKYIDLLTPPTKEKTNLEEMIKQFGTDLEGLKGRGEAQLAEEQARGVQAKKEALTNEQGKLQTALAEYKAIQSKYEQAQLEVENLPITMARMSGQKALINRMALAEQNAKASEIALIQANISILKGNLADAQNAADRAVDLKYGDLKDSLDIRLQQIKLIEGELDKKEKIRADALTIALNDQKNQIAIQVANEKDKNATIHNIMQSYPDAGWKSMPKSVEEATAQIKNSAIYQKEVMKSPGDLELQPTAGFFDAKIETSVREDYNDLLSGLSDPANPTEEELVDTFTTLRRLYSPQEVTDDALLNLMGIKPTEEIPTPEDVANDWLGFVLEEKNTPLVGAPPVVIPGTPPLKGLTFPSGEELRARAKDFKLKR